MKSTSKNNQVFNNLSTQSAKQLHQLAIAPNQLNQIKGGNDIIIIEDIVEG